MEGKSSLFNGIYGMVEFACNCMLKKNLVSNDDIMIYITP